MLAIVLIIAATLRFYRYSSWSLSNDELSALHRLQFDSFGEMIEKGVKLNDFHPAGVQAFLYFWTKLFGFSEAIVRLPFILSGIVSVYLVYLIGKKWFNKNTGLLSALSMAFLQFPLLYSQLARPYSPGLLFSLATVWFWTLIVKDKKQNLLTYSGFVISCALSAYSHNYSFLFVLMVGVTGLFFLKRKALKNYILCGLAVFILYLPHFEIFFYQFGIGGIGGEDGWLGKPDSFWFFDFIYYCFNKSVFLLIVFGSALILSLFSNLRNIKWNKFYSISLIWFFTMFFIGYFYSIFRNPILQKSILIFSFPFLLMFIFSFIKRHSSLTFKLFFVFLAIAGTINTVFVKDHYNTQHFGEFKDVAKRIADWNNKFGSNNITAAISVNQPYYIDYYLEKYKDTTKFVQYDNRGRNDLLELKKAVDSSKTQYFVYAWTKPCPFEIPDIIMTKYPFIINQKNYSGFSEVTLFGKTDEPNSIELIKPVCSENNSFENGNLWGNNEKQLTDEYSFSGEYSFKMDSAIIFGPTFSTSLMDIDCKKAKKIKVSLNVFAPKNFSKAILVLSLESNENEIIQWTGSQFEYYLEKDKWGKVFLTFYIPESFTTEDILKTYVWNPGKESYYIDDFKIELYE